MGIYVAPGNDLNGYTPEQLGTYLVNNFRREGLHSECFLGSSADDRGTALNFGVNGLVWDNEKMLNLQQATNAKNLKAVTAEAKTGKALLNSSERRSAGDSQNP